MRFKNNQQRKKVMLTLKEKERIRNALRLNVPILVVDRSTGKGRIKIVRAVSAKEILE